MDLTITILTYHHPDYVARVAEALAGQLGALPQYEVVLVNNGGCAETTSIAKQDSWRVTEPGYNTSYAEGHNLAARAARGEYLLQLNDDCIPESGFLAALWRHREAADLIGGLQLDPDGRVNHAGGYFDQIPWPRHAGRFESGEKYRGLGVRPTAWVTGAVLMVRRALFHGLGGFDEIYYYGCEDADLCARAVQAGCTIGVNLDAVSVHGELGTRPGGPADAANEAILRERWQAIWPQIATQAQRNWMPA